MDTLENIDLGQLGRVAGGTSSEQGKTLQLPRPTPTRPTPTPSPLDGARPPGTDPLLGGGRTGPR
jgi:hypothetical protein